MKKALQVFSLMLLMLASRPAKAQQYQWYSRLSSILYDYDEGPLDNYSVDVYRQGELVATFQTDDRGRYTVNFPRQDGYYELLVRNGERTDVLTASLSTSYDQSHRPSFIAAGFEVSRPGIEGWYVDSKHHLIPEARVVAIDSAGAKHETRTDDRGFYRFSNLKAGTYTLVFHHDGVFQVVKDVPAVGGRTWMALSEDERSHQFAEVNRETPFYSPGPIFGPRQELVLSGGRLDAMSSFNLNDQLSTLPGFYQQRSGGELNVQGARTDGNLYIVDGIQLR